jgi:DNA repair ATPase RecN
MSTFTKEEVDHAVAEAVANAVAPLQAELDNVKAKADADAVDARIVEVKAEFDVKLEDMQKALDAAVIEAQAAKEERDSLVSWLENEKVAQEEASERIARTEERLSKVKEVANFPDDFVEAQTERWVSMSDEDFDATVEGYKVAAEAAKAAHGGETTDPLAATAMKAERDEANGKKFSLGEFMKSSRMGFDPRTV